MSKLESVLIQTASWCNLRCFFCPNSVMYKERPKELMTIEDYEKILDNLAKIDFQGRFSTHMMSEPLLDKRLPELIKMAKETVPKMTFVVTSNGTLATPQRLSDLFDSGLDGIFIDCYEGNDQYDAQQFFDKMSAVAKSLGLENKINVRYFNQDFYKMYFYNRAGNINFKGRDLQDATCMRPSKQMCINYLGKVILCCSDWKYEVEMGDITKEDLNDIWNNTRYQTYRESLEKGNRDSLKLCSTCDYSNRI